MSKSEEDIFNSEEEAILWVSNHTAFAVRPKRKAKTDFINPFTSYHAYQQVTKFLGKELYRLLTNKEIQS